MNPSRIILLACALVLSIGPAFGGDKPPIPPPDRSVNVPENPDARRAHKIAVLEQAIAADRATIANPGDGKRLGTKERVRTAKENLAFHEDILAKVKAGADREAYFCSACGKAYRKVGTCRHCKVPLKNLFAPGAKRPSEELHPH